MRRRSRAGVSRVGGVGKGGRKPKYRACARRAASDGVLGVRVLRVT